MALQIRHTGQDAGTSMYETEACRAQGAAWKGSGGGDRESKARMAQSRTTSIVFAQSGPGDAEELTCRTRARMPDHFASGFRPQAVRRASDMQVVSVPRSAHPLPARSTYGDSFHSAAIDGAKATAPEYMARLQTISVQLRDEVDPDSAAPRVSVYAATFAQPPSAPAKQDIAAAAELRARLRATNFSLGAQRTEYNTTQELAAAVPAAAPRAAPLPLSGGAARAAAAPNIVLGRDETPFATEYGALTRLAPDVAEVGGKVREMPPIRRPEAAESARAAGRAPAGIVLGREPVEYRTTTQDAHARAPGERVPRTKPAREPGTSNASTIVLGFLPPQETLRRSAGDGAAATGVPAAPAGAHTARARASVQRGTRISMGHDRVDYESLTASQLRLSGAAGAQLRPRESLHHNATATSVFTSGGSEADRQASVARASFADPRTLPGADSTPPVLHRSRPTMVTFTDNVAGAAPWERSGAMPAFSAAAYRAAAENRAPLRNQRNESVLQLGLSA